MVVIPQRELRNDIASILRRAEAGETFTVTVNGRPVAELRPLADPRPVSLSQIIAATPVDSAWAEELRAMRTADRAQADNLRDPG